MPTLKSAVTLVEQQQEVQGDVHGDVVKKLILRFPYKEYGIAEDGSDAIIVSMPGGMRVRMPRQTIDYYSKAVGGDVDGKEDYTPIMQKIDAAMKSKKDSDRVSLLKEIIRHFSDFEFKPEKYSFLAYALGRPGITIDQLKNVYAAYAGNDPSGLTQDERQIYDRSLNYSLSYYKFLIGALTVID